MRSSGSLLDLEDDFQATSLKVFESKKLWSEFQAELSSENVTNPTAVRAKLRQFISDREDELSGPKSFAGKSMPNFNLRDHEDRKSGGRFSLNKVWNPLDGSKSNETFEEADKPQKPVFLSRLINPGKESQVSESSNEKRKSWVFTEPKDQEEIKPRRGSIFTPWRRDTGSTSDLTTSFTTALSSDMRRGSNTSLASIDSRASEIEETRRLEASARRGSYHDDLFEDFYTTQVRQFSISDRDNDLGIDYSQDGQSEEAKASSIRKRASIDLDERPDFYTSRPNLVQDLSRLGINCVSEEEKYDQGDTVVQMAPLCQSSSEVEGESDDDKSNNGVFEFSTSSRKLYQLKCTESDSDRDFSSFIDEVNSLTSGENLPEGKLFTLSQISGMQPKPVRKRGTSDKQSKCGLQDSRIDITESKDNQASTNVEQKREWLRFSWGPRNGTRSSFLDDSERTSTTLNEAALPSNRRFSGKRPSWNVKLLNGQSKNSNQDLTEAPDEEDANEDSDKSNAKTPEVRRISWNFRKEPDNLTSANQESDAAPNEESVRKSGIYIDPSLFAEIRGETSKKESDDHNVDWGEINDSNVNKTDFIKDKTEMAQQMHSEDAYNESEDASQEEVTFEVPTFNLASVNNSFAVDDNSCCTNDSDAAVVLQIQ